MESLTRLVSESMTRNGVKTFLDPRRLQWSPWFRCESNASTFHVPGKPGLFALAEEVAVFSGASESRDAHPERGEGSLAAAGKRMLALFHISEADDVGMALGRLFLEGNSGGDRLSRGCCFARYAVIEEACQRRVAYTALQQWLASSAEIASGFTSDSFEAPSLLSGNLQAAETKLGPSKHLKLEITATFPSGF
jgi:hypothetical protein